MKSLILASLLFFLSSGCDQEQSPSPNWPYEREEQQEDRKHLDQQQLIDERSREVNYEPDA